MLAHPFRFLAVAVFALLVGLCATRPPAGSANGDKDKHEEKGGHAHVPALTEYADIHGPLSVGADAAMIAGGREIYTTRCAVCHGDSGDGKGPAALALPLKPANFRDKDGVAEMRDNYWFWRVSEGGQVEPFKSEGSAMPPWKGQLSVEERWAVMAYQHTFSGHQGPHVPWEHPESVAMGRDIYAMACVMCHGVAGKGDGSVGPMLSPRRAPQPPDFTRAEFQFRATPPERLSRGKQLYADAECLACHGERGRGDGPSAPTLKDNRNLPIAATDLTKPERFKNGARPEDVYRTLMTGLAGTPMPSYADSLEPDQAWDLVFYVLSLSRGGRTSAAGTR